MAQADTSIRYKSAALAFFTGLAIAKAIESGIDEDAAKSLSQDLESLQDRIMNGERFPDLEAAEPATGFYEGLGDSVWSDDPDFPPDDWRYEVINADTRLGYRDWVAEQKAQRDEDLNE